MNAQDEKFRVLFTHSTDAHLLFNENGIIDCNDAAVNMLGCRDKKHLLSSHPAEFSPEHQPDGQTSLEKSIEMDRIAKEKGYHRFEWIHRKMDGTDFPVEVTLNPVVIGGKAALLVVWHDLTERKKVEEALRQNEAALQEAQEVALVGSFEYEPKKGKMNWTKQAKKILGLEESSELSFEKFKTNIHPEDKIETHTKWGPSISSVEGNQYEFRFRNFASREYIYIHVRTRPTYASTGELIQITGSIQDVTERRLVQEKIQENPRSYSCEEYFSCDNES